MLSIHPLPNSRSWLSRVSDFKMLYSSEKMLKSGWFLISATHPERAIISIDPTVALVTKSFAQDITPAVYERGIAMFRVAWNTLFVT